MDDRDYYYIQPFTYAPAHRAGNPFGGGDWGPFVATHMGQAEFEYCHRCPPGERRHLPWSHVAENLAAAVTAGALTTRTITPHYQRYQ